ncbi:MAG: nucleotidyltransferase family protein [Actinomycetota bacterium]|nr:nucleotidyltransferase family protein [Actinomycetota bacterium]
MTAPALTSADEWAARLATIGLVAPGEPTTIDRSTAEAVCATAAHQGLACLLGAAVERGTVRADEATTEVISAAWAQRLDWCVRLDSMLLAVVSRLTAADIPVRVLKGVAVATLDEPDPSWRSYGDIDVLVPADRLLAAIDALAGLGLQPAAAPVGRHWLARHGKGITLTHPSGVQVDLHRLLAPGPFGSRVRMACAFERGRTFEVGGTTLTAMADVHRFLHACYHAVLGRVRGPRHRRDVLLLARTVRPAEVAAELADGWSAAVVHAALTWAGDAATLPAEWAQWLAVDPDATDSPHRADRELLAAYSGSFGSLARAELRALRGPLAKARYAAALVWPSRGNLAARGQRRRDHLVHLLRTALPHRSAA